MRADTWHIVTCEYPPTVGGVSDYAAAMAGALAGAGHAVHVWCPEDGTVPPQPAGVTVHPVAQAFAPAGLKQIGHALSQLPGPRHLFVQWVPHGFGYRAMNLFAARWVAARARQGDHVHLLVHEPFMDLSGPPRHVVVALVQRLMLFIAAARAERIWVSTPSWLPIIAPFTPSRTAPVWLPIPAPHVAMAAAHPTTSEPAIVGHFSTHAPLVTALLAPALDELLRQTTATVRLIGRDSDRFRSEYLRTRPSLASRVTATGVVSTAAIDEAISGCTVMLQPYPDGISTRRTSALTLMSSGVPIVTNAGHLTEDFWREDAGVELIDTPDGTQLGAAAAALLGNAGRRAALARQAAATYDSTFDIRHGLAALTTQGAAPVRLERARA